VLNALASDVAVTWLGALGTAAYFRFLWNRKESTASMRVTLFLVGVLTALLALRGFFWLWEGSAIGRFVFMAATLLPLAITLYTEHLLRRHHPRWFKMLAVSVTAIFSILNLIADLSSGGWLLLAFLVGFLAVIIGNAWFLLLVSQDDLSRNELRIVRAVVLSSFFAAPLVVTDFREEIGFFPVRLGALGALLFVYVLLNLSDTRGVARQLILRLALTLLAAMVLAGAFALSIHGLDAEMIEASWRGLPVGVAWMLLTAIVVRIASMSAQSPGNVFLRWLLLARLDSAEGFLRSLRKLSQTDEHLVLGTLELAGYSLDLMFQTADEQRGLISLTDARAWALTSTKADAAEQLVDLLEKHQMTHVLLISREPPLVVLLNLPQGASAAIGELRAGVIQRLARRFSKGSAE